MTHLMNFLMEVIGKICAMPWWLWMIVTAVTIVITFHFYHKAYKVSKIGNSAQLPICLIAVHLLMCFMYVEEFADGGEIRRVFFYKLVKGEQIFDIMDTSTWGSGMWIIAVGYVLMLVLNVIAFNKKHPGQVGVFLTSYVLSLLAAWPLMWLKGKFLLSIIYTILTMMSPFVYLISFIIPRFDIVVPHVIGGSGGGVPTYGGSGGGVPTYGGSGGGGGGDHDSDYGALLRMPATIKDQYGNVYTRMNFNYDGTSVDYSGDYTVVTIYAEDVKLFSAKAGDRYFTW